VKNIIETLKSLAVMFRGGSVEIEEVFGCGMWGGEELGGHAFAFKRARDGK